MPDSVGIIVRQFLSFAGLGLIGTSAHYATLFTLVEALALNPVLASSVGFVVGALVNYYLTRTYTFRSSTPHVYGLPKFAMVAAVGMFLNTSIMSLITFFTSIHYIVAQIVATGIILIWNFLGNRFWTFAPGSKNKTTNT